MPETDQNTVLSHEALAEIEKRPASAGSTVWYHIPLTPTERDALCASLRAAWAGLVKANDAGGELLDANQELAKANAALRDQLAQAIKERDDYRNQLLEAKVKQVEI